MWNKILGEDKYYVLLSVPITLNDVRTDIVTTFNKKQAKVAQDILSQPHDNRLQFGVKILNYLDYAKAKKELKPDTMIDATLKTEGGLIQNMPIQLHWRTMRMLGLVCVSGQDALISVLRDTLRNIEAGIYEAKSTVVPFKFMREN